MQIKIKMKEIQPTTIDEVLEIIRFYEQEGLNADSPTTKTGITKRASVMVDRTRNHNIQVNLSTSQHNALTLTNGNYRQPANVTCYN